MLKHYKLEGKKIVECRDLMEWAEWYETACYNGERHVALDFICGIRVSTVFLGLDHRFFEEGAPILFETMVFAGDFSELDMRRYCIYEEAEAGHKEIVKNIKHHPWSLIVLPWVGYAWRRIVLPKLQVVVNKVWELGAKIKG